MRAPVAPQTESEESRDLRAGEADEEFKEKGNGGVQGTRPPQVPHGVSQLRPEEAAVAGAGARAAHKTSGELMLLVNSKLIKSSK